MATQVKVAADDAEFRRRLFTFQQAADELNLTFTHVRNMADDGRIGHVKVGVKNGRRISGQQILDFIERNRVDPLEA